MIPSAMDYFSKRIKRPQNIPGANYQTRNQTAANPFFPQNRQRQQPGQQTGFQTAPPPPSAGQEISAQPFQPQTSTLPQQQTLTAAPIQTSLSNLQLPTYQRRESDTPAPLSDPGAISDPGKLYERRVLEGLQGKDPASLDAIERANTQASRNLYMAGQQGQEDALAGGLGAGSLQYQRTQDRALAGAREANLGGAQGLTDYLRTRTNDLMSQARGVEDTAYGRATGERDEAGALRLENRGNVDAFINSFGDQKFKNYLRSIQAQGGDVYAAAGGGMDKGTILPEYRSQDPVQAAQESAASWVRATQPSLETSDPTAFQAAVVERMRQTDKSIQQPLAQASAREAETAAINKFVTGDQNMTEADYAAIINGTTVPHEASLPVTTVGINSLRDAASNGVFVVGNSVYRLSQRRPDGASGIYNYIIDQYGNYQILYDNRWEPADPGTGKRIADLGG